MIHLAMTRERRRLPPFVIFTLVLVQLVLSNVALTNKRLWSAIMRRLILLLFGLLFCSGCGKKPEPVLEPAPEQKPDLGGVAVEPPPLSKPEKWPPKPVEPEQLRGQVARAVAKNLRSKDRVKIIQAMKAIQVLGPQAAEAIPDVLAVSVSADNLNDPRAFEEWRRFYEMHNHVFPEVIQAVGKTALPYYLAGLDLAKEDIPPYQEKWKTLFSCISGLAALGRTLPTLSPNSWS